MYGTPIEFDSEVLRVVPRTEQRGWTLHFRKDGEMQIRQQDFDFVVVATGMYGTPLMPKLPGMDTFRGLAMHASCFQDKTLVAGKKVLVVGGGKSAIDSA